MELVRHFVLKLSTKKCISVDNLFHYMKQVLLIPILIGYTELRLKKF